MHLSVMADALMPTSEQPLNEYDKADCDKALAEMANGIQSLLGLEFIL